MKLKKNQNIIRLKKTLKKEGSREVVRQLILNTIYKYGNQGKSCYIDDLLKEIKTKRYFKNTKKSALYQLIREELKDMNGTVTFIKEKCGNQNKIMVVPTSSFFKNFDTISIPNYTHTRASRFTEYYLVRMDEKKLEQ